MGRRAIDYPDTAEVLQDAPSFGSKQKKLEMIIPQYQVALVGEYNMPYLCIAVEGQLRIGLFKEALGDCITLNKQRFLQRRLTKDPVFYDWIVDSECAIQALEIHLRDDHPLLRSHIPLSQIPYIDTKPYPRIWFSQNRNGIELGKEAFGDIYFFEAEDGRLAVVVGIDEWLSPFERDRLLNDLAANGAGGWPQLHPE